MRGQEGDSTNQGGLGSRLSRPFLLHKPSVIDFHTGGRGVGLEQSVVDLAVTGITGGPVSYAP